MHLSLFAAAADHTVVLLFAVLNALLLGAVAGWFVGRRESKGDSSRLIPDQSLEFLEQLRLITSGVAADVNEHTSQVEAINRDISALPAPDDNPIGQALLKAIARTMQANDQMQKQLVEKETRLEQQAQSLEVYLSEDLTDSLTGLSSRRGFEMELNRRVAEWRRRREPLSLFLAKIDGFAELSDRHGKAVADTIIKSLGRVLCASFREMDAVARYGLDEFGVIMPAAKGSEAIEAAQRAHTAVAASKFRVEGVDVHVSISSGVTEAQEGDAPPQLIKRAEASLCESRDAGRNQMRFHDGGDIAPVEVPETDEQGVLQC